MAVNKASSSNPQGLQKHVLHVPDETKRKKAELEKNAQKLADDHPALAQAIHKYTQNIGSIKDYKDAQGQIRKAVENSPYWKSQSPKQREEGIKNYTLALLAENPAGGLSASAQRLADEHPAIKRSINDYGATLKQGRPSLELYTKAASQIAKVLEQTPYAKKHPGSAEVAQAARIYTSVLLGNAPK